MKKNLLFTLSVSLLSIGGIASSEYNSSGTNYSNALAGQEKWSEDMANEFVSMPNSFACIISNSGADANPNASWTALIDEAACGLADADPKGGKVYSSSAMKSSRASNTSPQEVTAWFNAQGGTRYIADVTLKQGAGTDGLPPFGEWYFAFYSAGKYDSGSSSWTSFTKATSDDYGYVDIGKSGNDVSILVATEMNMEENMNIGAGNKDYIIDNDIYAKVLFVDGSSDNTKFLGKSSNIITDKATNTVTGAGDGVAYIAGATNKDYYFRQQLDKDFNFGAKACFSRANPFETVHQSGLYNSSTGAKVNLKGGFGFELADGTRGYLGSFGVWIDGGKTQFTTSKKEIAVTDGDGASFTLKWAPGKLEEQSFTTENLSNGDTFDFYYHSGNKDVDAVWDAANSRFNLFDKGTTDAAGTLSTTEWDQWMWSNTKRSSVRWKGGTTIELENRKDLTFSSTFTDVAKTKFYSKNKWNNLTKASILPVSLSEFKSNGSQNFWDGTEKGSGGTNNETKTYFFTGSTPGGSLEPHTLYMDNGDGNLTTDDARVRFDFAVNDSQTMATNYADGTEAAYSSNSWPAADVTLVLASEADTAGGTCDKSANKFDGCKTYRWQTGAMPWDQSKAAYNAAGTLVELDDPIMIEYTYNADHDRNGAKKISYVTEDEYNPIKGCTTNGSGKQQCDNIEPKDYNGSKFMLEYDGTEVQGVPGLEVCSDAACSGLKYFVRLVNLKDGTELTDTKGNKYRFLAHGVSSTFTQEANTANCDAANISFTSLADLGIAAADIPGTVDRASTDYPLPSSVWTDAPTTSKCTVTMGDSSGCSE